jgi:transposase
MRKQSQIGDNGYDFDKLDSEPRQPEIELIASHPMNRKKHDPGPWGRLRRYRRRSKTERLFAWLEYFRKLVVRHQRCAENIFAALY